MKRKYQWCSDAHICNISNGSCGKKVLTSCIFLLYLKQLKLFDYSWWWLTWMCCLNVQLLLCRKPLQFSLFMSPLLTWVWVCQTKRQLRPQVVIPFIFGSLFESFMNVGGVRVPCIFLCFSHWCTWTFCTKGKICP